MLILGKTAFNIEEVRHKIEKGMNCFEFQLLNEFPNPQSNSFDISSIKPFLAFNTYVIHAPLEKKERGLSDIEVLCTSALPVLEYCFQICQMFAETQRRNIILVVHSNMNLERLKSLKLYREIEIVLHILFERYKNVILGIENVSPFNFSDGRLILNNNHFTDNVELVKKLKRDIGTDRIGSVFDTCHSMITQKYITPFYFYFSNQGLSRPDFSISKYMELYKDTCILIHLASMEGNGYSKGHGTPFKEEDKKLIEFVDSYKKFRYKCPITLEVREDDYFNPINYLSEREALISNLNRFK